METGIGSYNRFLQGDRRAFEDLVTLYAEPLVRFARSYLPSYADAEDAMMDVFAALIVRPRRFRNESAFRTYLFRAVRNRSIDKLRRNRRIVPLAAVESLPAQEAEESRGAEEIFSPLSDRYKDVLRLVYVEGFSVEETGKILGKSRKQVYNLLCRAKSSLKKTIVEDSI